MVIYLNLNKEKNAFFSGPLFNKICLKKSPIRIIVLSNKILIKDLLFF